MKIGGLAVNEIEHWEFADNSIDDELIMKVNQETTKSLGAGHPLFYENMINVLENKDLAVCDGEEGLKSLSILEASYRSAKQNKPVYLPLK